MATPSITRVNENTKYADGPFPLVETPAHMKNDKTPDKFVQVASRMALAHNVIIRGLNSVYKQAPHVKKGDYKDFVSYAYCWYEVLQLHHDTEEQSLFPALAKMTNEEDIMEKNVSDHRSFDVQLKAYADYTKGLKDDASSLNPAHLQSLIDDLAPALLTHLSSEIPTLLALSTHPAFTSAPNRSSTSRPSSSHSQLSTSASSIPPKPSKPSQTPPTSPEALLQLYSAEEKKVTLTLSFTEGQMFFFYNLDRGFEEGRWKDWPAVPETVRWVVLRTWGAWNKGWWRFASCGVDGELRMLEALK